MPAFSTREVVPTPRQPADVRISLNSGIGTASDYRSPSANDGSCLGARRWAWKAIAADLLTARSWSILVCVRRERGR